MTTSDKKKTNRKRRRSEESTNQKAPNNKEEKLPITNHMQHHGKGVYSGTFSGEVTWFLFPWKLFSSLNPVSMEIIIFSMIL